MILYRFKESGNDSFIDFLKGFSTILVILSHTVPHDLTYFPIWGGSKAVPIFLVIQIFHAYKKGNPRIPSLNKIFSRVIWPFILFQSIIFVILLVQQSSISNIISLIKSTIVGGGNGPGSYYIYIYTQFALILPFIYKLLNRFKIRTIFVLVLIISILLEVLAACVNLPDYLYRLLAIRYSFLIFFGFLWVREGIVIGKKEILLGTIGFLSVLYFTCFYEPLEPIFFDTNWKTDRWICFLFVMYLFVPLLFLLWKKLNNRIVTAIQFLGKCSYEIFLMQMLLCVAIKPEMINSYVGNEIISLVLYVLIVMMMSIMGGVFYYRKKFNCLKDDKFFRSN